MTDTSDKLRALFLSALMVLSVVALTVSFAGTAAAQDRTFGAGNTAPVTVFDGESVDISNVEQTGGGTIGSGTVGLEGISGDADGTFEQDEGSDFDFSGVASGGYDSDGDDSADIFVEDPEISSVTLYRGVGTGGADITDGSIPASTTDITVETEYNFDQANDPVEITVTDENGVGVTNELNPNVTQITNDGGLIQLQNVDAQDAGTYNVTMEGSDELDSASDTVSFTIRDEETTISLQNTEVTKGETVTGTVEGTPGDTVHVRVDQDNTESGTAASQVFRNTSDVTFPNIFDDGSTSQHVAVYDLGDSGSAQFQIDTSQFEGDNTATAEVAVGTNPNDDADAEVDLRVNERGISIADSPSVVQIGETFTINGTAPESNNVKAWVKIGSRYEPLYEDSPQNAGNLAEDSVDTNDEFEIEVDSSEVISLADSYRLAVTADAGQGSTGAITTTQYNNVDVKTSFSVRTVEGDLTAQLSSSRIASDVGDEVTLSGTALGQGDDVRLYVVGPRGNVQDASGAGIGSVGAADTVSIDDNQFDEDITAFNNRGTYQIMIVGQGRDGGYAADGSRSLTSTTQQQALEILRDEYDAAGSDDQMVELSIQAENAQLSIDELGTSNQVPQDTVTVSGTSNREDGTIVFLEVLNENDEVIASNEAEVNGSTNTWETEFDMSEVETGTYTMRADDDEAADNVEFEVVEEVSTPTETPEPDTETPEPDTETPEPDTETPEPDTETPEPDTETPEPDTETATPTEGSGPGFGVVAAALALVAAALLALRRRD